MSTYGSLETWDTAGKENVRKKCTSKHQLYTECYKTTHSQKQFRSTSVVSLYATCKVIMKKMISVKALEHWNAKLCTQLDLHR